MADPGGGTVAEFEHGEKCACRSCGLGVALGNVGAYLQQQAEIMARDLARPPVISWRNNDRSH